MTCHNRVKLTIVSLRCFFAAADLAGVKAHAYLTDDGSTDGTSDEVNSEFGCRVTVISGSGHLYWTGGMCIAAARAIAAGEPLLLLLNDDSHLNSTGIQVLLADSMRTRSPGRDWQWVLAGALADPESGVITYGGVLRSTRWNRLKFQRVGTCGFPIKCSTMNGNAVLIPTACWELVGGLDMGLPHRAADFDLGLRLSLLGISVSQSSEIIGFCARNSYRAGSEPGLSLTGRLSRAFGVKGTYPRSLLRYSFRHGGWLAPLLVLVECGAVIIRVLCSHWRQRPVTGAKPARPPIGTVVYCVDFVPSLSTGKKRATMHKVDALHHLGMTVNLQYSMTTGLTGRLLGSLLSEVRSLVVVARADSESTAFIGRGFCGVAAQLLAGLRGMPTVREIHGLPLEEVRLLGRSWLWRVAHWPMFRLSSALDGLADIRIFNNSRLLRTVEKDRSFGLAIVVPNGSAESRVSDCAMQDARSRLGLPAHGFILSFIGSASPWHDVESLGPLQREFDAQSLPVMVVAGGGPVAGLEPNGRSVSPLDEEGCNLLVRAAHACLLPSGQTRTSPGSPLKLYDYLANGRAVIAQRGLEGYGDEIVPHGVGIEVDFRLPREASRAIFDFLNVLDLDVNQSRCRELARNGHSWNSRMRQWLRAIEASRA